MQLWILSFLSLLCSYTFAQDTPTAPPTNTDSISYAGYPVNSYNTTLFYIKNALGPLSAEERAKLSAEKIATLEKDLATQADSIRIDTMGANTNIVYKNIVLVAITPKDAAANNSTVYQLAQNYRKAIISIIKQYQRENNIVEIVKRIGLGLLIIIILTILIANINRYINKLKEWTSSRFTEKTAGLKFKDYEFLSKENQLLLIRKTINIFKYLIIILTVYLALPIIFRLFPWTKNWSDALINFILTPLKNILSSIVNFIPDLISIIVIVMFFRYMIKGIAFLAGEVALSKLKIKGFYPDWAMPTFKIIRFVLYAFMLVVIWPFIPGSDSDIFKGVSVFLGLLISFGSSSAIGNMVAGLVITYMRPFSLKDRVKIGDVTGDVVEKSLLVTRIKTPKNEIITIPNSAILTGNTVNYTIMAKKEGYIVNTTITIGYDVPWRQVHELMINAALLTDGIDPKRKPFVLQTSLDDWYVSYQINGYTHLPERSAVILSQLYQNIQDKFNEAGVEIMSPHYQTLRDGNQTTIPADYLPKDYSSPGFIVKQSKDEK